MPDLQTGINAISMPPASVAGAIPQAVMPPVDKSMLANYQQQMRDTQARYDQSAQQLMSQQAQTQQQLKQDLAAPDMQVPDVSKMQAPQFTPQEIGQFGGLLMILGALAGRRTMEPATAAMNNMTAMLEGWHQRDMDKYNTEMAQFNKNVELAQKHASEVQKRRDEIIAQARGDTKEIQQQLHELHMQEGIELRGFSAEMMGAEKLEALQQQMDKSLREFGMQHDKFQYQQWKSRQDQAVANAPPNESEIGMALEGAPRQLVVGGWKNGAQRWQNIVNAAAQQLAQQKGISLEQAGHEIAQRQSTFNAQKGAEALMTKMQSTTSAAVKQLDYNAGKMIETLDSMSSSDLAPVLNWIVRGEEKYTGDPKYYELALFLQATGMEAARIMSNGTASTAQLHEGARMEAKNWMDMNMTPSALKAVVKDILAEGKTRPSNFSQTIQEMHAKAPDIKFAKPLSPQQEKDFASGYALVQSGKLTMEQFKKGLQVEGFPPIVGQ